MDYIIGAGIMGLLMGIAIGLWDHFSEESVTWIVIGSISLVLLLTGLAIKFHVQ